MQQPWHILDFHHSGAAEGVQRIIRESAFPHVSAHLAKGVVSREAGEAHFLRLDQPYAGSEGVLLSDRAGNDFLKIHLDGTEEVLGQVRTMEADCLVRVRSIVIVPIEKCRRSSGSQL